uniref:DUF4817 domain-containing protein n=1 Tax=Tetranychus urticae TaxID=32264 RepID=A0A158P5N4_TETUR
MTYKFSKIQKIDLLEFYIISKKSAVEALRLAKKAWNQRYLKIAPGTFRHLYKVYREYGAVQYQRKRERVVRTEEAIENVRNIASKAAQDGLSLSASRIASLASMSHTTAWRILRQDLKLKPYHIKLMHKLNEDDFDRRVEWCDSVLVRLEDQDDLLGRIIWTDEAIFSLSQTVNRHNCVYWDSSNPNRTFEADNLGSEKIMVWCGVWAEGRIGPYFYTENVKGDSYRAMLETFVFPKLAEVREDWQEYFIWQQDGAPAHFAKQVTELLDETFPEWLGRRKPWDWPPRSPDLTVCGFYLWGRLKDRVFARGPRTVDDLKEFIYEEFHEIDQEEIRKACASVAVRCAACVALEGKQLKMHKDYS